MPVDDFPRPDEYFCDECQKHHPERVVCSKGHCQYKHAKQIPDDQFPLFECMACGEVVFWD